MSKKNLKANRLQYIVALIQDIIKEDELWYAKSSIEDIELAIHALDFIRRWRREQSEGITYKKPSYAMARLEKNEDGEWDDKSMINKRKQDKKARNDEERKKRIWLKSKNG